MRNWDLTAGAAKLEMALKTLQHASAEIGESWDDATNERFQENYVAPIEPRVRTLLDALNRLAELLANAERQCRDEREE